MRRKFVAAIVAETPALLAPAAGEAQPRLGQEDLSSSDGEVITEACAGRTMQCSGHFLAYVGQHPDRSKNSIRYSAAKGRDEHPSSTAVVARATASASPGGTALPSWRYWALLEPVST